MQNFVRRANIENIMLNTAVVAAVTVAAVLLSSVKLFCHHHSYYTFDHCTCQP